MIKRREHEYSRETRMWMLQNGLVYETQGSKKMFGEADIYFLISHHIMWNIANGCKRTFAWTSLRPAILS